MKNRIYTAAVAGLVALSMSSCGDLLELDPFNSVGVDAAFENNVAFNNAIKGVYSGIRDGEYYGGQYIATPDILADNVIISAQGRQSQQVRHFWNMGGNATWALWDDGYRIILRANLILENIDNLADGDVKNNIRGQALAMRAMVHFDMARLYCVAPQHGSASDLGIPYLISSDASQKPGRSTVGETFTKIMDDLTTAASLIGDDNGVYQLNKSSVQMLIARVQFYSGNDAAALTALNAVLTGNPPVASKANFQDVWKDDSDEGVLFKMANTTQDNIGVGVQYSQTGPDGVRSEYVADFAFYQEFQDGPNGNGDIRLGAYFSTSEFSGTMQNHISKWFGASSKNANVSDTQVLRLSEGYLTRAEILASTDEAAALADLNVVRDQRYDSYTGGETGAALLAAIRMERRKELAFEGHRFFDLKRLNVDITRSAFGDASDGTGTSLPANVRTLPVGDFRFQLPIPQAELNANDNPDMKQNPGY